MRRPTMRAKRPKPRDLLERPGRELLRLLLEQPNLFNSDYCPRCRDVSACRSRSEPLPCPWCGDPRICLPDKFRQKAIARIRRACRKDPSLLPRVKVEWEMLRPDGGAWELPPGLPVELIPLWKQARRPRGRPFDAKHHSVIAVLASLGESIGLSGDKLLDFLKERGGPWVSREEVWRTRAWHRRQAQDPRARARGERMREGRSVREEERGSTLLAPVPAPDLPGPRRSPRPPRR